ncbi:MAG: hypothetical protein ACJ739_00795 [Acidimicrobiales bacterium]
MTDLLDPPIARPVARVPDAPAPAGMETARMADRWLLASLLLGAGAIHLVMAPSHLGESPLEGAGFLLSAWIQVGLAVAVLLRLRRRWPLVATAVLSAALIAVWLTSRTVGLPFGAHAGHAETVGFVDAACVGLEALAVVIALAMLAGPSRPLVRSTAAAVIGAVGVISLTTAAVASPSARDHASHSHGDHAASVAGGHDHGAPADDLGFAALSNGHQHAHTTDEALTSADTVALAKQLSATTPLIEQFPTLADAEAGGWHRAGPFSPGLGVHYQGPLSLNADGRMDPADLAAPMLIYDGLEPTSKLAGFMYLAYGSADEPEGFAGPNDHWHYHEHVCIRFGADGAIETPFGADLPGLTEAMCTDVGGSWIEYTGYMVHVWNVPGYESPDGTFTELNPRITCPDGTYHTIPTEDIGDRATTCRTS